MRCYPCHEHPCHRPGIRRDDTYVTTTRIVLQCVSCCMYLKDAVMAYDHERDVHNTRTASYVLDILQIESLPDDWCYPLPGPPMGGGNMTRSLP